MAMINILINSIDVVVALVPSTRVKMFKRKLLRKCLESIAMNVEKVRVMKNCI